VGERWTESASPVSGSVKSPARKVRLEVTVMACRSTHRVVDDHKNDWPRDTLRNPEGSPLLCVDRSEVQALPTPGINSDLRRPD
jgi:hypothetical protein